MVDAQHTVCSASQKIKSFQNGNEMLR